MSEKNRVDWLQAAANALTEGAKNPEATTAAIEGTIPILKQEIEMRKKEMARKWVRHLRMIVIHILAVVTLGG